MARQAGESSGAQGKAPARVHFTEIPDQLKKLPGGRAAESAVRRQSLDATTFTFSAPAATETMGADEDQIEDDTLTPEPWVITEADIQRATYKLDDDEFLDDVNVQLSHIEQQFKQPLGSVMYFEPITHEGQMAWPSQAGKLEAEEFKKMALDRPKALFAEFAYRHHLLQVRETQVQEMHTVCLSNNMRLKNLFRWARDLGHVEGSEGNTAQECEELRAKIAALEDEASQHQRLITKLSLATHLGEGNTGRGSRASTPRTEVSEGGTRRSGQIADPPLWYYQRDKDTVKFEMWHRQVENKLYVNGDHFADDRAKQSYIESYVAG